MENIAENETVVGKAPKAQKVPIQLKLDEDLVERLKRLGFNSRRSLADIATAAFEAYLPGAEEGVTPR